LDPTVIWTFPYSVYVTVGSPLGGSNDIVQTHRGDTVSAVPPGPLTVSDGLDDEGRDGPVTDDGASVPGGKTGCWHPTLVVVDARGAAAASTAATELNNIAKDNSEIPKSNPFR
jgi:hypothetical protein